MTRFAAKGSFADTLGGIRELADAGLNPIITATQTWSDEDDRALREDFHRFLRTWASRAPG